MAIMVSLNNLLFFLPFFVIWITCPFSLVGLYWLTFLSILDVNLTVIWHRVYFTLNYLTNNLYILILAFLSGFNGGFLFLFIYHIYHGLLFFKNLLSINFPSIWNLEKVRFAHRLNIIFCCLGFFLF